MSTIFRKIIDGEISCYKVYEDEHCLAFLDIEPQAKGHTLVIPKIEAETIFELDDEAVARLFVAVKRTMERIKNVLNPDGFNIGINHGEYGGQLVPHVHIHILPRYIGDGGKNVHAIVSNDGGIAVAEVARSFQEYA